MEQDQPPSYGVVDYPEQLGERFPKFNGVMYFFEVRREEQPYGWGGWRWRKWGPYLGKHLIHGMEYLSEADGTYGRPLIDVQWCFSRDKDNLCKIPYYFGDGKEEEEEDDEY